MTDVLRGFPPSLHINAGIESSESDCLLHVIITIHNHLMISAVEKLPLNNPNISQSRGQLGLILGMVWVVLWHHTPQEDPRVVLWHHTPQEDPRV
jgi:hypothetical protein